MNASREPLAALVAAWRDAHEAALAVCHDVGRAKYHREALRLLAAVEAGQKCAKALEVYRQHRDGDWSLPSEDVIRRGRDADEAMRAALADWKRVAEPVAPASHGSPEQGR